MRCVELSGRGIGDEYLVGSERARCVWVVEYVLTHATATTSECVCLFVCAILCSCVYGGMFWSVCVCECGFRVT